MPVNTKSEAQSAAESRWTTCRDAYDGEDAIKEAGTKYLPLLGGHSSATDSKYQAYKDRALFYGATARTIDGMLGAIFQKPLSVAETIDVVIRSHLDDVTLSSRSISRFAFEVAREVLITGRYGVLIDRADDASGRPWWVGYRAEEVVSYRVGWVDGQTVLTQVVLAETFEVQDEKDPFVTETRTRYRVLQLVQDGEQTQYQQVVYEESKGEDGKIEFIPTIQEGQADAVIVPTRSGQPMSFIPFLFFGPTATTPEIAKPPLYDLVTLNISHYRTMASLEHGRHWCGIPQFVAAGLLDGEEDNAGGTLNVGAGVVVEVEKDGFFKIEEFTGQGLKNLETADDTKRKMMASIGARMLEETPRVQDAAAAQSLRREGEQATLRTIASSLDQGLSELVRMHTWWEGTEATPADVQESGVEVNKQFVSVKMTPEELRSLVEALMSDGISFETFYHNLQKGGMTAPGSTVEEERKSIDARSADAPIASV